MSVTDLLSKLGNRNGKYQLLGTYIQPLELKAFNRMQYYAYSGVAL